MPSFYTRQPNKGIASSVRALLSSSPNLSETDVLKGYAARASADHNTALAEKIRLEIEREREADRLRSDPGVANEYASTKSGLTVPQGRQMGGYIRGDVIPPATPNDDEGNAMPPAEYARPDVSDSQDRGYRSAIAELIANKLATGKTNAEQLSHAGSNIMADMVRQKIAETEGVADQNQLKAALPGAGYREPFSRGPNAQGVMANQETGDISVEPEIHGAAVKALEALGQQREAKATQPDKPRQAPVRTADQEAKDRAYARMQNARADAAAAELAKQKQAGVKSKFRTDRTMKGNSLGNWVDGKGFEVLKDDKVIGFYD